MDVGDLERIWQLAGAGVIGLAIAAVALHALGSARARGPARARTTGERKRRVGPAEGGVAVIPPGGAMGWPFRRRGSESLRIQPSESCFHVLWRVGETPVAHLVVEQERAARGLYEWLGGRFGTGAERLEASRDDGRGKKERVLRKVNQRKPIRRRLAVLADGSGMPRVVEVVDGDVRSAARTVDREEAEELLELLADPRRAEALAAQPLQPRRKAPAPAEALATVES